MNTIKTSVLVVTTTALCACSHYPTPPYGISARNLASIRGSTPPSQKISVVPFLTFAPGLDALSCRGTGPVKPANGATYEKYIQEALVTELKFAGVYSSDAPIKLQGRLDSIDFNSNIGFGSWKIEVTISGDSIAPFKITTAFPFSADFSGAVACNQAANAFPPAVQQLIGQVVSHPSFKQLTASSAQ